GSMSGIFGDASLSSIVRLTHEHVISSSSEASLARLVAELACSRLRHHSSWPASSRCWLVPWLAAFSSHCRTQFWPECDATLVGHSRSNRCNHRTNMDAL